VFPVSLILTALLQFFISYAMAMLAFWLLEISTFIFILFAFEYLASGHLFPWTSCRRRSNTRSTSRRFRINCISDQRLSRQVRRCGNVRGLGIQFLWVVAAYVFAR